MSGLLIGPPVGVDSVSRDSSLPSRSTTEAPRIRVLWSGGGQQPHVFQHRQRRTPYVDRLTTPPQPEVALHDSDRIAVPRKPICHGVPATLAPETRMSVT